MNNSYAKRFFKFISNRIFILSCGILLAFSLLIVQLFQLQIVEGEYYLRNLTTSIVRDLTIPAPRGSIYDVYGRPLAVNVSSFTVKIDPGVVLTNDELNDLTYNLVLLLNKNNEKYIDEFPISTTQPYKFLFDDNESRELSWKKNMSIPEKKYGMDATETLEYLQTMFNINTEDSKVTYPDKYLRDIISIRTAIYMQRYRKYEPITVAYEVSDNTVAEIEEQSYKYPGVYVVVDALRDYPNDIYTSHQIGYIRKISDTELTSFNETSTHTYDNNDIVGKTGLEKSFEFDLKGTDGVQTIEANNVGRITQVLSITEPIAGNDIYTTIDSELQASAYHLLEQQLTDILVNKLLGKSNRDINISIKQFFYSFVDANNYNIDDLRNSVEGSSSYELNEIVINSDLTDYDISDNADYKSIMLNNIDTGIISPKLLTLVAIEQGIITADEELLNNIQTGRTKPLSVIISKLQSGEITPQMTNLDPSTGSVVVVNVNDGSVLASANYPSYDNNRLTNNFDNEYYSKIMFDDPTAPMTNRAFMEPRAPGSTFKMITGITALEYGSITPVTKIYDELTFTKAGKPYLRCWSSSSHGSINVVGALEVSCNYFFSDVSYRLGNAKNGTTKEAIAALNDYMIQFGLNERTGVEVGELADHFPEGQMIISSPEYEEYLGYLYYDEPPYSEINWTDGDTVATSIGQSKNNYTTASMAKYTATLANGGNRYQLHFLDSIRSHDGELVESFTPNLETTVKMSPETLDTIHRGMRAVIIGERGTGRNVFKDFPIEVAGKTGTAQERIGVRSDHSSFAGFAPYTNPEIAVYVTLPYGNVYSISAPATQIAKGVMEEYFGLNYVPTTQEQPNSFTQ